MKKRLLCVVLAMTMLVSLAGCGAKKEESTSTTESSVDSEETKVAEEGALSHAEAAIQARKESGEMPTISMAFFSFTGPTEGAERVNALMSAHLEETLGIKLEVMNYELGNYAQQIQLGFASEDAPDLMSTSLIGLSNCIGNGYFYDLEADGLLENYGAGIIETVGMDAIETCRVDGTLYAIPNMKEMANGLGGVFIRKERLDAIGYDYETAIKDSQKKAKAEGRFILDDTVFTDYEGMTEVLALFKAAYPDKGIISPSTAAEDHMVPVDLLGGDPFGILDYETGELKVENLFTNEKWLEYLRWVRQLNLDGYISADSLTNETAASTRIDAFEIVCGMSNSKPGQAASTGGGPSVLFQMEDYYSASDSINDMPWGISSKTEDPVAAMQVLNALFTDAELSRLLCWGEEGVEYNLTEDGRLELVDAPAYDMNVEWEMPNQMIAGVLSVQSANLWEQYEQMNEAAVKSAASGFLFDNSGVQNEYIALTNVWQEYKMQLMLGFVDPDEVTPELVKKLEKAGLDKYMEEKQRQLDEWAAANGK
ncbi:ABC transporter substrate-binding protein [Lachnotalea sp. AF33-28]|uniref:ABC transporter substrate-binding protein n=1 Tax=Lachnotalea sp. AF33-28 TaxID=2292046 RepID=UPI000E518623|nr:ABC transporter substrate-binding protein [Lachnotalea sp. AF33-28]RHP36344.1 extracellular solute-binding protein [Lachnotalea sp. AF33-28]